MKLLRMTACFGRMDFDSLELQDGLNLFYLPNEGGKSTWCAFLLTMLYGFHPRARDKKGMPSEKNRYRPWNGKPMEGLLDCFHNGSRILLRHHSADGIPMGSFSAIYADSGDPVPGLTAENVGMRLTGVGREIFERSLLIRQTHLAVSQRKELEARISALISSGDEQISWSQVEARLREWQLPRQSRKHSRLSELEAEEQSLTERISQLETLCQDYSLLEEEIAEMEALLKVLSSGDDLSTDEQRESLELRWAEAAAQLDAAQLQLQALTNDPASSSSFTAELEADIRSLKKAIRNEDEASCTFPFWPFCSPPHWCFSPSFPPSTVTISLWNVFPFWASCFQASHSPSLRLRSRCLALPLSWPMPCAFDLIVRTSPNWISETPKTRSERRRAPLPFPESSPQDSDLTF